MPTMNGLEIFDETGEQATTGAGLPTAFQVEIFHTGPSAVLAAPVRSLSRMVPLLCAGLLILCSGCTAEAPQAPLVVFAAASTAEALDELKLRFAQEQGVEIDISYAGSSHLAAQIGQGAPADLFLSASEEWADTLEARGLVAERRDLLGNVMVLIVPADSVLDMASPEKLTSAAVTHLALADPQAVPAGKYAREALEKLELWGQVETKVVAAKDVRQALMFVERGEAEAGIVYATDAAITSKVKVVYRFDPSSGTPIRYPWVRLKHQPQHPAAEAFYEFICSPEAAEVFKRQGFIIPG